MVLCVEVLRRGRGQIISATSTEEGGIRIVRTWGRPSLWCDCWTCVGEGGGNSVVDRGSDVVGWRSAEVLWGGVRSLARCRWRRENFGSRMWQRRRPWPF